MVKMGTITVDFAGTRDEARQFVVDQPLLHLAHKASPGEELPMLSARYTSRAKRSAIVALLNLLGWDEGSFGETVKTWRC